ncbi:CBS domain-containing protein [Planosporangium sp. 12N6]|uniref:CBS domain-containing protein n=1 Tax=Planosporangium spinosum TaxID=3402278 RepID=UPI003CEB3A0C
MRVRDLMSTPVYTVRADTPVEDAAALLTARTIAAAPVLGAANEVVGMVSEADLLRDRVPDDPAVHPWRSAGGEAATARPASVADVMTGSVVTAGPGDDVADVARLMLDRGIRSIPVVDDGELVGIISRRDIMRAMVRTDDTIRQEAQYRLDEYAGGSRRWTVAVVDGTALIEGAFDDEVERQVIAVLVRTVPGVVATRLPQHA